MISYLKGKIIEKSENYVCIKLKSGIGYKVFVSENSDLYQSAKLDLKIKLYVSHQIRETDQSLYGFVSPQERNFFELLTTVSGVGPKLASTLLAHIDQPKLADLIINDDVTGLTEVPGIGKKGAERLIVELKDKILDSDIIKKTQRSKESMKSDGKRVEKREKHEEELEFLAQALEKLGFVQKEIEIMLKDAGKMLEKEGEVEDVLKRILSR